jgi:hypothetical protein
MVTADGSIEQTTLFWSGNPAITKSRAAKTILNRLRLKLLE